METRSYFSITNGVGHWDFQDIVLYLEKKEGHTLLTDDSLTPEEGIKLINIWMKKKISHIFPMDKFWSQI